MIDTRHSLLVLLFNDEKVEPLLCIVLLCCNVCCPVVMSANLLQQGQ